MNITDIIIKLREREVKWKDIAYALGIREDAARMNLKRKLDIVVRDVQLIIAIKLAAPN